MEEVDKYAKIIWEYMLMHQTLEKADAIFLLGSNDKRLCDEAAELFKKNYAPMIICSGGTAHQNDINNPGWNKPEATVYKERLVELGIPEQVVILETEAQSTGDNANLIKKLIQKQNLLVSSAIIIQKPFMERRTYATFKKQWPELQFMISSPKLLYDEFMNSSEVSKEVFLNVMVGDLQRIKEYPAKGFQIPQEIPDEVWHAYEKLVELGFTKYLIKD